MTMKSSFRLGYPVPYRLALIAVASSALAAQERVDWSTIDCGGGLCSGAGYSLNATIGQHDAATSSIGVGVRLCTGYWPGSTSVPPCPADFNANGTVDTPDLTFFLGRFGEPVTPGSPAERADFNADGQVNTADLIFFLGRFSTACP